MSGIPAGTELIVSELSQDSETIAGYRGQIAAQYDENTYRVEAIRAFNLSFKNRESDDTYQPGKPVSVSIKLLSDGIVDGAEVALMKFDGQLEVVGASIEDQTLSFSAGNMGPRRPF